MGTRGCRRPRFRSSSLAHEQEVGFDRVSPRTFLHLATSRFGCSDKSTHSSTAVRWALSPLGEGFGACGRSCVDLSRLKGGNEAGCGSQTAVLLGTFPLALQQEGGD